MIPEEREALFERMKKEKVKWLGMEEEKKDQDRLALKKKEKNARIYAEKKEKARQNASDLWNQKLQQSYVKKGKSHELKRKQLMEKLFADDDLATKQKNKIQG